MLPAERIAEEVYGAFASVPEQPEAKRLLESALAEGGAQAFLLHGPAGVGKRSAAFAFAAALWGTSVESRRGRCLISTCSSRSAR